MIKLDLPDSLDKFRDRLEATIKPYVEIRTHFTREVALWESKIAGFPYLPKNFEYPTTADGEYLHLLAQINFDEAPNLEGFPITGILQFYIGMNGEYGADFENPTNQSNFRVIYFSEVDSNESNLRVDFDFLPNMWENDKQHIPFYVSPHYTPRKNDCFALSFNLQYSPMPDCDHTFQEIVGNEIWEMETLQAWLNYQRSFLEGHRIGGYPHFTQTDFRQRLPIDEEPYMLLLQIDFDQGETEKVSIEWGDCGVGNFWIKDSALKKLDFSNVWFNWDCS